MDQTKVLLRLRIEMNIYIRTQQKDLCKYLNDDQFQQLVSIANTEHYEMGSVVQNAGERPDSVIVLSDGELSIKDEKSSAVSARIYAGEMACELHYIKDIPAPYSIIAAKASKLNRIPFAKLDQLCAADPDFCARIQAAINDSLCIKIIRLTHSGH